MKLSAYLSPSRHGIYYSRWPLPCTAPGKRRSIRISLRTRCPERAGDAARYLASCGKAVRDSKDLARLRHDEIRVKVQTYFKAQLEQYLDWLDRRGMSKNALADAHEEMLDHDCMVEIEGLFPKYLPAARFKRKMAVSDEDWEDSLPRIAIELRKGRRDMLRAVLDAAKRLETYSYSYSDTPSAAPPPPASALPASARLGTAIEDFIFEHSRQWAPKTVMQNRAYLNILLEYFGPERSLATISKQDASEVKKILQVLPSSRMKWSRFFGHFGSVSKVYPG